MLYVLSMRSSFVEVNNTEQNIRTGDVNYKYQARYGHWCVIPELAPGLSDYGCAIHELLLTVMT
jgi:hypothetical protein